MSEESGAGTTKDPVKIANEQGVTVGAAFLLEGVGRQSKGGGESESKEAEPCVTQHAITTPAGELAYTVTTGMMPICSDKGDREAEIFYIAYTRNDAGPASGRPLMFSFNGGPGSSSVWLHLGALGPKRVPMLDDGNLPAPPYKLEDNPYTWLEHTDLVFIDPVGTGFSRPSNPDIGKKFWGVNGDIASIAEFIRLYLTRNARWSSPLFLVGESYGTTRAAGLSGHLVDRGIALNGIALISSILSFQTALFGIGNDLPYVLFLPTYVATAFYHKRLSPERQTDLPALLAEVEEWAITEYATALARGDSLSEATRAEIVTRLSEYTGLSEQYLDQCNMRIEIQRFCKELLRDKRHTVGRLDSRITGYEPHAAAEHPEFDPSMSAIRPPYTAMFNDYIRGTLGYKTDREYYILGGGLKTPWNWDVDYQGYADTSEALREAFAKNPYMKLFVASGYYDLATPYFATRYTLNHMGLEPVVRKSIRTADYPAGHMMYIHTESLKALSTDIAEFLQFALTRSITGEPAAE